MDETTNPMAHPLQVCGTGVVATVFKLRPGSRVLAHTGTSNRRLVLQFALSGSRGVRFRVGHEWRSYDQGGAQDAPTHGNSSYSSSPSSSSSSLASGGGSGDGQALVFDDSFEHEVFHGGDEDRYVLYAALYHPDLMAEKAANVGTSSGGGGGGVGGAVSYSLDDEATTKGGIGTRVTKNRRFLSKGQSRKGSTSHGG